MPPPYIPDSDSVISESDIYKYASKNISIQSEIDKSASKYRGNTSQSKHIDWDISF